MRTTGVVRCDQPRALDLAARHDTKLERLPDAITAEVVARFAAI
jgi:mRNA interferase ChpB